MSRVLIVDDEPAILEGLEVLLTSAGYEVEAARDGREALAHCAARPPDLVLLDLLMPGLSGLEVCQRLRREGVQIPIIMVTAKGEESDKVLGLDLGADDYVVKPFGTSELLARVRALLRRLPSHEDARQRLGRGDLVLDCGCRAVWAGGRPVALTVREFHLLWFLVEHEGRLVTREELLQQVWGYAHGEELDTRTVDNHVGRVRRKVGEVLGRPCPILTVRGAGYRFEAE